MNINFLDLAKQHIKRLAVFVLAVTASVMMLMPSIVNIPNIAIFYTPKAQAGSLTSVKDTLSTSRPSASSTVTSAITAGDTTINVNSTIWFQQGDTVTLCNTSACSTTETKVIASVLNSTQLSLTVGTTNSFSTGAEVYLKQTAKHVITFTTRSAVSNGKFVVTLAGDTTPNNDVPEANGFDFNRITTATGTEYTLTGATFTTAATSTNASNIVFTFNFSGTVASNTAISITMGNTNPMLNPIKTAAQGTADILAISVAEQDNGGNTIDSTSADVGTIEVVGVSATVSPSMTFTINAVSSGTSVTSHNTSFGTSATSVPFGTLTVNASSTGAQYIHVDTNSNSGYAVTVQQDGSLRKSNGTTITDFNSGAAAEQDGNLGFGYSLQSKAGSPTLPFNYNDSSRKFNAIGFSSTTPATVMSNTAPANGDETYIDYYLKVNAQQAQGTYQNVITLTATATY